MSAKDLLKALNPAGAKPALGKSIPVHTGLRAPSDAQLGCRNRAQVASFLAVPGSSRVVPKALLLALSLSLVGCAVSRSTTTTRLIPPARAGAEGAQELASAAKQPEAPSAPVQPAPQPAQRVSETKPPPASASKGAEKLATPSTPAVVRASERTTLPAQPSVPKAPVAVVSGTVTDAPVQALVFRGPPPEARSPRSGIKWWVWLGLGGAALAIVAWFSAIRRAKSADLPNTGKDDLKMPPELLFKEPLNLPQEIVLAEEP